MSDRDLRSVALAADGAHSRASSNGPPDSEARDGRRRERRRLDWRLGGRSARKWDYRIVAVALLAFGLGVLGAALAHRLSSPWLGSIALWIALASAVVVAFARARPAGLLRLRSMDFLWGVGAGVGLRLVQGALSQAHLSSFPVATRGNDSHFADWIYPAVGAAITGPIVEELFFRAVILVSFFQLLRRAAGALAAASAALLVSSGGFVLLHVVLGSLALADAAQLLAVGAACSLLVLMTGRVWGAVIAHVVYNVTYIALAAAGTLLS